MEDEFPERERKRKVKDAFVTLYVISLLHGLELSYVLRRKLI